MNFHVRLSVGLSCHNFLIRHGNTCYLPCVGRRNLLIVESLPDKTRYLEVGVFCNFILELGLIEGNSIK